jgi:hypothetical protein
VKYATSAATGSHYYYTLGIGHLLVEITQHSVIAVVCWTGHQKDISMFRIAHIDDAESFYIVEGSKSGKYLYIAAITATTIKV